MSRSVLAITGLCLSACGGAADDAHGSTAGSRCEVVQGRHVATPLENPSAAAGGGNDLRFAAYAKGGTRLFAGSTRATVSGPSIVHVTGPDGARASVRLNGERARLNFDAGDVSSLTCEIF